MRRTCRIVTVLLLSLVVIAVELSSMAVTADGVLTLGTWNVRGYPEKTPDRILWFSGKIAVIAPDVLCLQEIANQADVNAFLSNEAGLTSAAFENSRDRMDNAVFFADGIQVIDIPDPQGFQHPAQAIYLRYQGLDAMLITVHLSWTDTARRVKERNLLGEYVKRALGVDPDVIVAGDFNTTEKLGDKISSLADSLGLHILASDNSDIGTTYAGKNYDFILVSPDLADEEAIGGSHIIEFGTQDMQLASKVSDHRPVIAQFRTDEKYSDCTSWPPQTFFAFSWDTVTPLASPTSSCISCLETLNSAIYSEFHAVDGIGDTLAQRLVDAKPYASTAALTDVQGIGRVKMQAIINFLCTESGRR